MTTRPGYIWSGTEWVSIGQEAVVAPVSYQTSAPSTPSTGDIWIDSNDDVPGIDTSQFLRWRKTAVGGETSVSGTDDNGLTLQYTANYEQVYLNGVLLVRGQDYTATNGTSITGLTALAANDVVEVFGVVARVVGDVYTQAQADAKYSLQTTTGLVLINSTTFTAASSVQINNIFTSGYANYRILYRSNPSTTQFQRFRLSTNGTPNSSASYAEQNTDFTTGTTYTRGSGFDQADITFGSSGQDQSVTTVLDIFSPQESAKTYWVGSSFAFFRNTFVMGSFEATTSFDGIQLYPSVGTMTGTIKVYGYK